jgi:hypothetical protein
MIPIRKNSGKAELEDTGVNKRVERRSTLADLAV